MNFIVALQPEARPLIEGYKLIKRNDSSAFPVFENENHRLIISGIGRINAAAATGYLLSQLEQPTHAILNLGIAGHGELPTGIPFLANRVLCAEEKTVHYPPPVVDHPITRSALQTCKAPEKSYPQPIGYDMEAHAICSVAYKSVTRELVQVIKVVSDNPSNPLESFEPRIATDLITKQLHLIDQIVEQLDNLAKSVSLDPSIFTLIKELKIRHHFTATQTHQLEKVIQQAHALGLENSEIRSLANSSPSAKSLINDLNQKLEPLRLLK